jgi:hypothetical protein
MDLKKLLLIPSLLVTSTLYAVPLTWNFSGTTDSGSTYNGMSTEGLAFELRIFLDTNLAGVKDPNNPEVSFFGPFQGEAEIETLGVLPVDEFLFVQYFAPGGLVTSVIYYQPGFSDIAFPSSISGDSLHLGPIPPTAPNFNDDIEFGGPNGLFVFGTVTSFSATTGGNTVPESGSTALFLTSPLVALALFRRRQRARLAAVA